MIIKQTVFYWTGRGRTRRARRVTNEIFVFILILENVPNQKNKFYFGIPHDKKCLEDEFSKSFGIGSPGS